MPEGSGKRKIFIPSTRRPERPRRPTNPCSIGNGGSFLGDKAAGGVKLTTDLNIVPRLRTTGALPPHYTCFHGVIRDFTFTFTDNTQWKSDSKTATSMLAGNFWARKLFALEVMPSQWLPRRCTKTHLRLSAITIC